jgi:hypothetical protein
MIMSQAKLALQPKAMWYLAVSFILTFTLMIPLTSLPAKAAFNTSSIYKIVNKNSGKLLDVYGKSTADGANVIQWLDNGQTNQQWKLVDAGNGYYKVQNVNSGKVLDVADMSTANGANVQQWTSWSGGTNQEWQIVDAGSGYYTFINRNSGKALDVYQKSTADGANIQQYTDNGGANQQWQLVDVGSGSGSTIEAGDLVVAPNGSSSNPGTLASPTTLSSAISKIGAGNTIWMRGGTYSLSATITSARTNSGSSGASKNIFAYGTEKPVLDFSAQSFGSANRGLQIYGHYWYIKGIRITGAGDNGLFIGGNNNVVENVELDHNRDSGLQISRYDSSLTNMSDWPSNNLILNSYSHDNFDPDNGEDADGFAAKLTVGTGNVFDGCIAAYNVDDGWDLFSKTDTGPIAPITIRNSISYRNGQTSDGTSTTNSDGNGFKLGGDGIAVNHIVQNSIAFLNKKHGFTYNSNPGSISMKNNTSWSNGQGGSGSNFAFDAGTHQFTNNLSFQSTSSDKTSGTDLQNSNVWWKNGQSTNGIGFVVSSSDFVSLTPSVMRNADGSPNLGNFLKLASGSDLIGAGVNGQNIGAR